MVSRWNSSSIFPRIHHVADHQQSPRVHVWNEHTTRRYLDGLSSCRCSMTSHGDLKTMNRNANQALTSFSNCAKRFPPGRWSFLGRGSEKMWYSTHGSRPQGEWDRVAELMTITEKANIQSSDPQVHGLEECSKAKVVENYQYTSALMRERLKLFSHNYFC